MKNERRKVITGKRILRRRIKPITTNESTKNKEPEITPRRNRSTSSDLRVPPVITIQSDSNAIDSDDKFKSEVHLLKLLHYYHQLVHLMINNNDSIQLIKNDLQWIQNTLDRSFKDLIDNRIQQFSLSTRRSIIVKQLKTWKEFKDAFETDECLTKNKIATNESNENEASEQTVDGEKQKRDQISKDDWKSVTCFRGKENRIRKRNEMEKAWAGLPERPRRSCTLKKTIRSPDSLLLDTFSEPSNKKLKTDSENIGTNKNKNVEELVVNCDPFKYVRNSNYHIQTTTTTVTGIAPITQTTARVSNTNVQPILPLKIIAPQVCMPIMKKSDGNITTVNRQQMITTQSTSLRPLVKNVTQSVQMLKTNNAPIAPLFPITNQPVKGKVLLINSVPCLVQNGNQIQLPMLPSSGIITAPMSILPNIDETQIQSAFVTKSGHKSSERTGKNSPIQEVIKIEDDSDSEMPQTEISKASLINSQNIPSTLNLPKVMHKMIPVAASTEALKQNVVILSNSLISTPHILLTPPKNPSVGNVVNVPISNLQSSFKNATFIGQSIASTNKSILPPKILKSKKIYSNVPMNSTQTATSLSRKLILKSPSIIMANKIGTNKKGNETPHSCDKVEPLGITNGNYI